MASPFPRAQYYLEVGSTLQRARLVKFMQRAYRDMGASQTGQHLADTVERHLSPRSQLWWLVERTPEKDLPAGLPGSLNQEPVGCLWLGEAIDQRSGEAQAYVFLLYVAPHHRGLGLGSGLMEHAQQWAKQRGYRQVSLQVFEDNLPALRLYSRLGYQPQARWLTLDI